MTYDAVACEDRTSDNLKDLLPTLKGVSVPPAWLRSLRPSTNSRR